jgi:hypothetical protein
MKNFLIKAFNKVKKWYLKRQKEKEREPENIEEKLQEFLEFLFIKEEYPKERLRKKLFLGRDAFNFLNEFAKNKGYITEVIVSKPKSDVFIKIKNKGIDFLFEYRKIRAQEKSNTAMKWATIVIAGFAGLTFYLSLVTTLPQVAVTDNYFCPASFWPYEDYSTIVNIPLRNIGKMQSQTNAEFFGINANGEAIKNNYLIPSQEDADFSFRVTIDNSTLDYAEYYFKINYKKLFNFIGISATKTCRYKKDGTGGFIRQKN